MFVEPSGHNAHCLDNKIGDNGTKAIGDALKVNASLTELELKHLCTTRCQSSQHTFFNVRNGIGEEGAKTIARGLEQNKSLKVLNCQSTLTFLLLPVKQLYQIINLEKVDVLLETC